MRVCFDLDHTLMSAPKRVGDYSSCEPIEANAATCRALYEQGHYIIVYTSRGMRTSGGNLAAAVAEVGESTIASLRANGIRYHELAFGKPEADFYIDGASVSSFRDLQKEIGVYPD